LRGAERRGNPDKIPPLSVKAAKRRKKVWIASRHGSLALAMTRAGTAFFNNLLEHVAQKWTPVLRNNMRKNKKIVDLSRFGAAPLIP